MAKFGIEYRVRGIIKYEPPLKDEPFDIRKRMVIIARSEREARDRGDEVMMGALKDPNYRFQLVMVSPLAKDQVKEYLAAVDITSNHFSVFR